MANSKFSLASLANKISVDLTSDYILVEKDNSAKRTTLKNITQNTVFDELRTKSIEVNGTALKGFFFKGAGQWINETTMYDCTEKKNVSAVGNAGYIYQETKDGQTILWASTGKKWFNTGLQIGYASSTEYGVVKIGSGIEVVNGVISTTGGSGGSGGSGSIPSFIRWKSYGGDIPLWPNTISFSTSYGTLSYTSKNIEAGNPITSFPEIKDYDASKYQFYGWYCGSSEITESYIPTSNMSLIAKFITKCIVLGFNDSISTAKITYGPIPNTVNIVPIK